MYIRRIEKKVKKADGTIHCYHQHRLIHAIRTSSGPRQVVVLHLGTLTIPEDQWPALAQAIERKVMKQRSLIPLDEDLERLATHYAQLILQHPPPDSGATTEPGSAAPGGSTDYEEVDLNSTTTSTARTIGGEHVALSQMKELQWFELLQELGFSAAAQRYATVLVVGRMVHPSSEWECARWVRETSGIGELLHTDLGRLSDNTLHRTADVLLHHQKALEGRLAAQSRTLFSLGESLILYDLTNTYFESPKRKSDLAAYGHSKEKRTDCPVVTLALVVDGQGFPKLSKVYKGNVAEGTTLAQILTDLPPWNRQNGSKPTIVIDAGIASEANLTLIRTLGYEYVAISRARTYPSEVTEKWARARWQPIVLPRQQQLEIKSARTDQELLLLCRSDAREHKECEIWTKRAERFEHELTKIQEGLGKKRAMKNYVKIVERIGRLKERYRMGQRYRIEVTARGKVASALTWEKLDRPTPVSAGEYVLRTSRLDWSDYDLSHTHRMLGMIESAFRWMKSNLGLRPNFHHQDRRIRAHILVSVLAYFFLAAIMEKMDWGGTILHRQSPHEDQEPDDVSTPTPTNPLSWESIVRILASHIRVTTSQRTKDNRLITIRTSTDPTARQQDIYARLGITPLPLRRTIVKPQTPQGAPSNPKMVNAP